MKSLKRGERLGKYRIERVLGSGGFGTVYRARDTVEDTRVALKIIPAGGGALREDLLREVRMLARLDHPNILRLKNADVVGNAVVMAYPLGETTLADRLRRRLGPARALGIAEQVLEAVAHAHQERVIHCDIKPDNVILFPDHHVALADFGIAKVALETRPLSASGAGTLGYLAPEQALGKPSFRSDVFALGLLIHELLTGYVPEWPFQWPPSGHDRLRRVASPALIDVLRRALQLNERKRFRDARAMRGAFKTALRKRRRRAAAKQTGRAAAWEAARVREFQRSFGKHLGTRAACPKCDHPVSQQMAYCPWCGVVQRRFRDRIAYRVRCRRCGRGVRADWRYCAFCFGAEVQEPSSTSYRPPAGSRNCRACRAPVPPMARFCPTCRAKVRKPWPVPGSIDKCPRCRWGVITRFWRYCPWCARSLRKAANGR